MTFPLCRPGTRLSLPLALPRVLPMMLPMVLTAAPLAAQPIYCPETPLQVAVVGDSLADGIWGAMFRGWQGCQTVTLHRVTAVSEGLTVTAPADWAGRLAESLGDGALADIVVFQFGANDIRPIRTETGRAAFGTPEWQAAYATRAAELLSLVAAQAAPGAGQAFWLGLPVVGNEDLEPSYVEVSAIQAKVAGDVAAPLPTTFVDLHAATTFGTGAFVHSLEVEGSMTQLRADDMIHFTEKGYELEVAVFAPDLEARLKARDADAALTEMALQ